ncbi:MAG: efflux RND transporter periplasmic adaptor subunit, partial [Planctomycetes bacterium]|nr:efflux RND transporter periplasmic adaptor subunit [Planctomycetota bacterium]
GLLGAMLPRPPRSASKPQEKNAAATGGKGQVWTLRDGRLVAVPVVLGATNGVMTQVLEGDVEPGMKLVVEAVAAGR